jgi:hypothetical protein
VCCILSSTKLVQVTHSVLHLRFVDFCKHTQVIVRTKSKSFRLVKNGVPCKGIVSSLIVIFPEIPIVLGCLIHASTTSNLSLNLF